MKRSALFLALFVMSALPLCASSSSPSCDVFHNSTQALAKSHPELLTADKLLGQYLSSSEAVYAAWCGDKIANESLKQRTVDVYAAAYRTERLQEADSNEDVRQQMSVQMLALLGITKQLPSALAEDAKLREAWLDDCETACFAVAGSPAAAGKIGVSTTAKYQMEVRDELLGALDASPASSEVKRMLWTASNAVYN